MPAPLPADEAERVARLHALSALDTDAEPLFDALTLAASLVAGAPIALLTLVDGERQWFKANVGLAGVAQMSGASAFSAYTILEDDLLEVADARSDARFAANPLVTGAPYVRFHAGVKLAFADGLCIGSLCVIDHEPRTLSDEQRSALKALGKAATEALELRMDSLIRRSALEGETATAHHREAEALRLGEQLRASEAFLDRTGQLAGVGGWQVELELDEILWTDETCRIHDLPTGYCPTLQEALDFYEPAAREVLKTAMNAALDGGASWDLELQLVTATGRKIWVHVIGSVERFDDGRPQRVIGAIQDVSIRKRVVSALEASDRRFRKMFEYSLGLICTHDAEGVLLSVNPAAADSLGYKVGELLGRPLTDFIRSERHPGFLAYLKRIHGAGRDTGVMELVAKDGTLRIWQYQNVLDHADGDPYVLGHAQDITASHHHALDLQEMSLRDPLTGCYNRRFLGDPSARNMQGSHACIAIDLDHFKQVNDTFGHQRGDEVLVAMARFLLRLVRPSDAVIRLGGDEFMVLMRDADQELAKQVVARLEKNRASAPIAFTLGWSAFGPDVTLEQGLAEADDRLYEKRAARDMAQQY